MLKVNFMSDIPKKSVMINLWTEGHHKLVIEQLRMLNHLQGEDKRRFREDLEKFQFILEFEKNGNQHSSIHAMSAEVDKYTNATGLLWSRLTANIYRLEE